jgi:hypothetical protein
VNPHLPPAPANDFAEFCETYLQRCRARVPQIVGAAAKWRFEDLIPGLSDFDTRLLLAGPMTPDDWRHLSLAVGEVHTRLAQERPDWHRNLEHLPGLNLTLHELEDPRLDFPEFRQWTFYGDDPAWQSPAHRVQARPWSARDEAYHLGKVATYFGPYIRGIDPPVNLKQFTDKYTLHSRYLHYFTPPVQAMVSLKLRRTVFGKLEALRLAREHLPRPEVVERVLQDIDDHYADPDHYRDAWLVDLEAELEAYLAQAWGSLRGGLTLVEPDPADDRGALRRKVAELEPDPLAQFFTSTRFCRQMEGRLRFYAAGVPGFDADWLIGVELGRIVPLFYHRALQAVAAAHGDPSADERATLDRLAGEVLGDELAQNYRHFAEAVPKLNQNPDRAAAARAVAELFPPILIVIEQVGRYLLEISQT